MSADFAIPGLMPLESPVQEDSELVQILEPHSYRNTLWQGIESVGPFTINGDPPYFPATKIRMELTSASRPCFVHVLSSEPDLDGTITITDSALWLFEVPEQELPLCCGLWDGVLIVTDSNDSELVIYRTILPITP